MSKENKHIDNTSFEEYKKYLEGKLSSSEQYAFEKKMLDDDFESEALSGFDNQDIRNVSDDIADLRDQLTARDKKSNQNYLKMAAVIAFFLSFTVALFFVIKSEKSDNLSDKTPEEPSKEQNPPVKDRSQADSIVVTEKKAEEISVAPSQPTKPPEILPSAEDNIALFQEESIAAHSETDDGEITEEVQNEILAINRIESNKFEPLPERTLEPIPETGNLERIQTTTLKPSEEINRFEERINLPKKLEYDEAIKERPSAGEYPAGEGHVSSRSERAREPQSSRTAAQSMSVGENLPYSPEPQNGKISFYHYINENMEGKKWPAVVVVNIKLDVNGKVTEAVVTTAISESKKAFLSELILKGPNWIIEQEEKAFVNTYYTFEIPINSEFR